MNVRPYPTRGPAGAARLALGGLICAALAMSLPARAAANMLRLEPMAPAQAATLSGDAADEYEQAMAAIDHILYEPALEHLRAAADAAADNPRLQFMVVQLATYLGDTRWGDDSRTFYDVAISHLRRLADSERLNVREKQRARDAVVRLSALQTTVSERDANRRQWGLQVAKQYLRELHGGKRASEETPQDAAERRQRQLRLQQLTGGDATGAAAGTITTRELSIGQTTAPLGGGTTAPPRF